MSETTRFLWTLVALLLAAVAVVAWIKTSRMIGLPEAALVAQPRNGCKLREGPCAATFPDGATAGLEITPRHIPVVEPLKLSVRVAGIEPQKVQLDFSGVDMNMGFNRVQLQPAGPGLFSGSGMLPVCVRARMTWEAKVLLETKAGLLVAPFRFDTYLPGKEPPTPER